MEIRRQLIHLSGLLFVLLAQFTSGRVASFCFFLIALSFLAYSERLRRERSRLARLVGALEGKVMDFAMGFERRDTARPFLGAFWFYAGCGFAFLLFPMHIASASCAMLAVGDSVSTMVGLKLGRRRIAGKKTLEGSLAFFFSSFLVSLLFVTPYLSLIGAAAATAAELVPETGALSRMRRKGFIDDNLLIPVIAGLFMAAIRI